MMANRRSLDRPRGAGLASQLAAAGHHVYTLDLRGHGESAPAASRAVDWSYDEIVDIDLPLAIDTVHARHPELPLALIGHSLSAHGGAACLGRHPELPVSLLVLLSANVWLPQLEPSAALRLAKRQLTRAWRLVTDGAGYFPARALRLGTDDEARTYVRQLCDWVLRGRWSDRSGCVDYLAALPNVRVPTLQINGRGDRLLSRTACARRFAAALTGTAVTFWEATATECEGLEPDHMALVTDVRCRAVWARLERWLREHRPDRSGS